MTQSSVGKGLIARLRQAATGPAGVRACDMQSMPATLMCSSIGYLVKRGELHKAKLRGNRTHYFACPDAAAAFAAEHQDLYVRVPQVRAPIEQAEDRAACTGSARSQRREDALRLRINAQRVPEQLQGTVRVTYGPTPTSGPLSGICPPDRQLVMRPGALDYQRHMARHRAAHASHCTLPENNAAGAE